MNIQAIILSLILITKTFLMPLTHDISSFEIKAGESYSWAHTARETYEEINLVSTGVKCERTNVTEISITPNYMPGLASGLTMHIEADISPEDVASVIISQRSEPEVTVDSRVFFIRGKKDKKITLNFKMHEGELGIMFRLTHLCSSTHVSTWKIRSLGLFIK